MRLIAKAMLKKANYFGKIRSCFKLDFEFFNPFCRLMLALLLNRKYLG